MVEHDKGVRARACRDSFFLTTVIVVPKYWQSSLVSSTNKMNKRMKMKKKEKGGKDVLCPRLTRMTSTITSCFLGAVYFCVCVSVCVSVATEECVCCCFCFCFCRYFIFCF